MLRPNLRLPGSVRARLRPLADRNLRLFFVGHTTSMLGSAMAGLATTFAVLQNGGTPIELGIVMAARILPIVLCLLIGGVVADRFGPRRVMIASDVLRFGSQLAFGLSLILGSPSIWVFIVLGALWGVGEAFFMPAQSALMPRMAAYGRAYEGKLRDANALAGLARSSSDVGGPALAGVLVATIGPGPVVLVDAATYAVSAIALVLLRIAGPSSTTRQPEPRAIRTGWREFRSRPWLWSTTLQMTLFNFLVWAPFLVLGPVIAQEHMGGARDWGLIMAAYAVGSVLGGLIAMGGRMPRRPILVATLVTIGWGAPSGALALQAPVGWVAAVAFGAGFGAAIGGALLATVQQQVVPLEVQGRIQSIVVFGAFTLGPLGLAVAGPAGEFLGVTAVLAFGVVFQVVTRLLLLAVPDVRRTGDDELRTHEPQADEPKPLAESRDLP